jgi:threonine/homoserine/homoserine lactone efflux protein
MIDVHALLAVALIFALGVMSPGPNFLAVAQRALVHGRTAAMATAAGVITVSALWASSSLFGLAIVFKLFPWTHLVLRIVGAAYLVWAGIKLWRHARVPLPIDSGGPVPGAGLGKAYRAGLATNLSNAKAIAFYTSIFSAAAPAPDKTLTLWIALVMVLIIAVIWYSILATVLSTGPAARGYRRAKGAIERVCGVLMIGFGVELAASR